MNSFLAVSMLDSCSGWIGALTLVVIGALVVRKADTAAGAAVAGAGLVKLILNCCALTPTLAVQYGGEYDPSLWTVTLVLVQLQRLAFFGVLAFGVLRLGKPSEAKT